MIVNPMGANLVKGGNALLEALPGTQVSPYFINSFINVQLKGGPGSIPLHSP